jgi:hypothetical protein
MLRKVKQRESNVDAERGVVLLEAAGDAKNLGCEWRRGAGFRGDVVVLVVVEARQQRVLRGEVDRGPERPMLALSSQILSAGVFDSGLHGGIRSCGIFRRIVG